VLVFQVVFEMMLPLVLYSSTMVRTMVLEYHGTMVHIPWYGTTELATMLPCLVVSRSPAGLETLVCSSYLVVLWSRPRMKPLKPLTVPSYFIVRQGPREQPRCAACSSSSVGARRSSTFAILIAS
jgi:hypothetical protein